MRRASLVVPAALALLFSAAALSNAVTMDGQLDPEYGSPLVVQANQTLGQDATTGWLGPGNGGELDALHALVDGGVLYLFVAGNMWFEGNPVDYGAFYTVMHVYVDAAAGGQNVLSVPYASYYMNGMTFDAGFTPEFSFNCASDLANYYDPNSAYTLHASRASLPEGGVGQIVWLGDTGAGGPGTLAGGTNPDGIQLAIDNRNVAGVTFGCGEASGSGVTTGVEWAIPLASLGNPSGCVRVSVMLTRAYSGIAHVLGPVPSGVLCTLGRPATTDFSTIAGDQYVTFCPGPTHARTSTWGSLKSLYR